MHLSNIYYQTTFLNPAQHWWWYYKCFHLTDSKALVYWWYRTKKTKV